MTAGRSGLARAVPSQTPRECLAGWLDQAAFVALALLALGFAFEWIRPVVVLRGGLALTGVELVLFTGLGLWAAARAAGWRRPQSPPGLALPALLWLIVLTMSSLLAPDHRADALKYTARTATGLLAGWAVYDIVVSSHQERRRRRLLLRLLAIAGVAVTLLGLAELVQWEPALRWLAGFKKAPTRVGDLLRISATLGYATVAAMVLELTLPLLLAWLLMARRAWQRAVLAIAVTAQIAVLVLTLTRGGVLALFAGLAVMAGLAWRRGLRTVAAGSLAAALLLVGWVGVLLVVNPLAGLRLKSESEVGWYQATYRAPPEASAQAGDWLAVSVEVANAGVRAWVVGGPQPFVLSYHIRQHDGRLIEYDGVRTPLPHRVAPGERLSLQAVVRAPDATGEYLLEWDMLQEDVTWFSAKGNASAATRLTVVPHSGGGGGQAPQPSGSQAALRIPPAGRLQLWRTALRMALARPLLGVGPDNFRLVYGDYAGVSVWDSTVHANNLYLEWLADTGLVGFAIFLWLNAALLAGVYRSLGRGNPCEPAEAYVIWQVALLAALTAWYIHGLLDSFYEFTPSFVAFWIIAGLALSWPIPPILVDPDSHATGI